MRCEAGGAGFKIGEWNPFTALKRESGVIESEASERGVGGPGLRGL